ncbi:MAG: hypothetical protein NVSMB32_19250 [Actinomycetota bacterium]
MSVSCWFSLSAATLFTKQHLISNAEPATTTSLGWALSASSAGLYFQVRNSATLTNTASSINYLQANQLYHAVAPVPAPAGLTVRAIALAAPAAGATIAAVAAQSKAASLVLGVTGQRTATASVTPAAVGRRAVARRVRVVAGA